MRCAGIPAALLGAALALGCGSGQQQQGAEKADAEAEGRAESSAGGEAPAAKASPSETSGGALSCPEGAEMARLSIDAVDTEIRWCERPAEVGAGTRHGPWEKRREGILVESGSYREGVRHGPWRLASSTGLVQEGSYDADQRVGVWVFKGADGEEVRRVDYGRPEAPKATAEGETSGEAEEEAQVAGVRVRIQNARSDDLLLSLEPLGESVSLEPGAAVDLEVGDRGEFLVESDDAGLTVRAQEGARLEASPAP